MSRYEIKDGMLQTEFIDACEQRLKRLDLTLRDRGIIQREIENARSFPIFSTLKRVKLTEGTANNWLPPKIVND